MKFLRLKILLSCAFVTIVIAGNPFQTRPELIGLGVQNVDKIISSVSETCKSVGDLHQDEKTINPGQAIADAYMSDDILNQEEMFLPLPGMNILILKSGFYLEQEGESKQTEADIFNTFLTEKFTDTYIRDPILPDRVIKFGMGGLVKAAYSPEFESGFKVHCIFVFITGIEFNIIAKTMDTECINISATATATGIRRVMEWQTKFPSPNFTEWGRYFKNYAFEKYAGDSYCNSKTILRGITKEDLQKSIANPDFIPPLILEKEDCLPSDRFYAFISWKDDQNFNFGILGACGREVGTTFPMPLNKDNENVIATDFAAKNITSDNNKTVTHEPHGPMEGNEELEQRHILDEERENEEEEDGESEEERDRENEGEGDRENEGAGDREKLKEKDREKEKEEDRENKNKETEDDKDSNSPQSKTSQNLKQNAEIQNDNSNNNSTESEVGEDDNVDENHVEIIDACLKTFVFLMQKEASAPKELKAQDLKADEKWAPIAQSQAESIVRARLDNYVGVHELLGVTIIIFKTQIESYSPQDYISKIYGKVLMEGLKIATDVDLNKIGENGMRAVGVWAEIENENGNNSNTVTVRGALVVITVVNGYDKIQERMTPNTVMIGIEGNKQAIVVRGRWNKKGWSQYIEELKGFQSRVVQLSINVDENEIVKNLTDEHLATLILTPPVKPAMNRSYSFFAHKASTGYYVYSIFKDVRKTPVENPGAGGGGGGGGGSSDGPDKRDPPTRSKRRPTIPRRKQTSNSPKLEQMPSQPSVQVPQQQTHENVDGAGQKSPLVEQPVVRKPTITFKDAVTKMQKSNENNTFQNTVHQLGTKGKEERQPPQAPQPPKLVEEVNESPPQSLEPQQPKTPRDKITGPQMQPGLTPSTEVNVSNEGENSTGPPVNIVTKSEVQSPTMATGSGPPDNLGSTISGGEDTAPPGAGDIQSPPLPSVLAPQSPSVIPVHTIDQLAGASTSANLQTPPQSNRQITTNNDFVAQPDPIVPPEPLVQEPGKKEATSKNENPPSQPNSQSSPAINTTKAPSDDTSVIETIGGADLSSTPVQTKILGNRQEHPPTVKEDPVPSVPHPVVVDTAKQSSLKPQPPKDNGVIKPAAPVLISAASQDIPGVPVSRTENGGGPENSPEKLSYTAEENTLIKEVEAILQNNIKLSPKIFKSSVLLSDLQTFADGITKKVLAGQIIFSTKMPVYNIRDENNFGVVSGRSFKLDIKRAAMVYKESIRIKLEEKTDGFNLTDSKSNVKVKNVVASVKKIDDGKFAVFTVAVLMAK